MTHHQYQGTKAGAICYQVLTAGRIPATPGGFPSPVPWDSPCRFCAWGSRDCQCPSGRPCFSVLSTQVLWAATFQSGFSNPEVPPRSVPLGQHSSVLWAGGSRCWLMNMCPSKTPKPGFVILLPIRASLVSVSFQEWFYHAPSCVKPSPGSSPSRGARCPL